MTLGPSVVSPAAQLRTEAVRTAGFCCFEQESRRAGAQGLHDVVVQIEHRQHETPDARRAFPQLGDRRDPVAAGHLDIHQDDVGPKVHRQADRGRPVGCLGDHLDGWVARQHGDQPCAQELVVVDHQHPDGHDGTASGCVGITACTAKPPLGPGPDASVPRARATRSASPTSP